LNIESLKKLATKSPKLKALYDEIAEPMLSTPPFSLGYPGDLAQSAYYPGPCIISKDEIALVSQALEGRSVFPENTRIRRMESAGTTFFEVLQASVEKDEISQEFPLPDSKGIVRMHRGDHSQELARICSSLAAASNYAANETQREFLAKYIESFQTGSLHAYRDSQRTWIRDKAPRVENIFGFVEPYRDPYGTRAEFESLVAISDTEETKALTKLVENSATFIKMLPWAKGTKENDGKGPFEKALFEPPDFASIHSTYDPVRFDFSAD
jgi:dipeptidyl-peptidase-3